MPSTRRCASGCPRACCRGAAAAIAITCARACGAHSARWASATHSELAAWAQTAPQHAKALFAAIADELDEVRTSAGRRWILAADAKRLASPPAATGTRVLGGHDPYVAQPDRATLVPDPAVRKRMFLAVGRPGAILRDEVEWLPGADIGGELDVVARLRRCRAGARLVTS